MRTAPSTLLFRGWRSIIFQSRKRLFSEMARVLKPGGKLVMIDMAAAEEPLRKTEDALESLRDPAHVRNLSRSEVLALYEARGLFVERCETVRMPVRFDSRMTHIAANQRSCLISAGR